MHLELKSGGHVSDILRTHKEVIEEKERISPVLDLGGFFVMHPNCSPPKDMMQNIPQKNHVDRKVLVERAIFDLPHIGTRSSRCDDWGMVYHLLIIGGVICCVIFIGKWNKDISHT